SFNFDNQSLDVFSASVISRRNCVLCHLRLTFHYLRRRRRGSRSRGSLICSSTTSGDTLQILLRVSKVLLGRVPKPEDEAELRVDEPELGNPGLDKLRSVTEIYTFYNRLTLRHRDTINAAAGGTFMKRRPEECYDLIENMTAHYNDWDTSAQWSESSSSITSSSDPEIVALKAKMAEINKNLMKVLQINQEGKEVTPNC
nr:reverse transcriptase domain-containing protein [Tanacetum cinerariifolium]